MRTTFLQSRGDASALRWPRLLAGTGDPVAVVLLDDAAALARDGHPASAALSALLDAGATVLVDTGALRRRGMTPSRVQAGLKPTDLAAVADLLADDTDKVVWL